MLPSTFSSSPELLVPHLTWREMAPLPDPVGRKGMYAGVTGGQLVLAGGSNFPVAPRAGGMKTFYRSGFVRPVGGADQWSYVSDLLPVAAGEGATVQTEAGVVCLGGHNGTTPIADVRLLTWNPAEGRCAVRVLPRLRVAVANAAAVLARGWIYVAGGESAHGTLATLWRLNLANALVDPAVVWESRTGWPGLPRHGCFLAAVTTPLGERLVLGGGIAGPARKQADYLRDVYQYDPDEDAWTRATVLPRGAVLGAVVPMTPDRFLLLGGSDGHDFERIKELGERYRLPSEILAYDSGTDRWTRAGEMPLGVVGASVAEIPTGWVIAGGEYSPGRRTQRVFELRLVGK
ncbi:hypothetical protein [Opitutus sp. ER46]|uniref:hypothetical protein n=1 Tax=Opitutus sp. ER46 TaxID=2161864 RepID=UPI0011B20270|nr:hypothetical protein [Opitutus sp. ER46]